MHSSPAQTWSKLIGATLVVAGIVGFFYSSAFGSPGKVDGVLGILDVNGWHNVVHIASGLLGLALGRSYSAARAYCLLLAVAYTTVAIWGFVVGDGGAILGFLPVNTEDNVLHTLIALVSLAVGLSTPAVPAPSAVESDRRYGLRELNL
jgi:UDP-N-acetylmuramyl pentapeptide phosphotransferase/UDP-N-acetylglucosamine-1-phosphate transferase